MSCPFAPFLRLAPVFASFVPMASTFYYQYPKTSIALGATGGAAALFLGYYQVSTMFKSAEKMEEKLQPATSDS
jgi:hypothetical protein